MNRQLSKVLETSYNNSQFYNELYKKKNLSISDLSSVENFERIPILTRSALVDNFEKIPSLL